MFSIIFLSLLSSSFAQSSSSSSTSTSSSPSTSSTSSSASSNVVNVTFLEEAVTVYGENIYLSGSIPELSSWSTTPGQMLLLGTQFYPEWTLSLELPSNTNFQYKYLRLEANNTIIWESGPNRNYTTPASGSAILDDTWNITTGGGVITSGSIPLPTSSGSGSSPSGNVSSATSTGKSSNHAGAIAGGVVGGLVFLGILIFGLIYWRRKHHIRPFDTTAVEDSKSADGSDKPVNETGAGIATDATGTPSPPPPTMSQVSWMSNPQDEASGRGFSGRPELQTHQDNLENPDTYPTFRRNESA